MQRANVKGQKRSAFDQRGLRKTVELLITEIKSIYLADGIPWVLGYSGGKDSTACLQLVWMALAELPREERAKAVQHVSDKLHLFGVHEPASPRKKWSG